MADGVVMENSYITIMYTYVIVLDRVCSWYRT